MHTAFKNNIKSIYGQRGLKWLDNLDHLVNKISEYWYLSDLTPIKNLTHNYVLLGSQHNKKICLKIGINARGIEKERDALEAFQNYGGVRILEYKQNALLLEGLDPGTSLGINFKDRKSDINIFCNLVQNLQNAKIPHHHSFSHILTLLNDITDHCDIPFNYIKKAKEIISRIEKIQTREVLLHGDLHPDNILKHDQTWKVIDPKGFIGYPINELWAFIIDPLQDTFLAANYFNYDVKLVREWYFVHLILNACWAIQDNLNPGIFLKCAPQIYNVI